MESHKLSLTTMNRVLAEKSIMYAINDLIPIYTHREVEKMIHARRVPTNVLMLISAHLRTPIEKLTESPSNPDDLFNTIAGIVRPVVL